MRRTLFLRKQALNTGACCCTEILFFSLCTLLQGLLKNLDLHQNSLLTHNHGLIRVIAMTWKQKHFTRISLLKFSSVENEFVPTWHLNQDTSRLFTLLTLGIHFSQVLKTTIRATSGYEANPQSCAAFLQTSYSAMRMRPVSGKKHSRI